VGELHSFDHLISDEEIEWLNGRQLRCMAALGIDDLTIGYDEEGLAQSLKLPVLDGAEARELFVFDPSSAEVGKSNVAKVFLESLKAKAIMRSGMTRDAIAIQFCEDRHWRFLALVGAERVLYYWDPFGDAMEESHALRAVEAANAGWRVVSIPHRLQSDGYQCGPWSHVALKLFAAYFKAGICEGFSESFAKHAELRPLDLVTERGRGAVDRAKGINSAFIKGVRDEARKQLRDADSAGSMPFKPDVRPAPPVSPRTRKAMQAQGGSAEASILL